MSFNFTAAVTICSDFGVQENKSVIVSIVPPSICYEVMILHAMIFIFWMLSFKAAFSLSSFTFMKRLFSSSLLSSIRCLHIWGYSYFSWQSWFQLVYDHRILDILIFRHRNSALTICFSHWSSTKIHSVHKIFNPASRSENVCFLFLCLLKVYASISLLKLLKYISWTSETIFIRVC